MPFTFNSRTVRIPTSCAVLLLAALALVGCNNQRTSDSVSASAPSATAEGIAIRVERITRYEGGIELLLAIDNRSTVPASFPRMQTTFPTLQVTDGGIPVSATRIERGVRTAFATPYVVAAGSRGRLIVQFNHPESQGDRPLTFHARAAPDLVWKIELPASVAH